MLIQAETKRAEKNLRRAEGLVYAGKLKLAQQAFKEGNGALALQYLEECQWNLRGWEHDHLWTRFNSLHTFRGHRGPVSCVAISSDGKRLVSGSYDKSLKIWDVQKGQQIRILKGHTDSVLCVAISPAGKRLVSGSYDKSLKIWDVQKGQQIRILKRTLGACLVRGDKRRWETHRLWQLRQDPEGMGHTESPGDPLPQGTHRRCQVRGDKRRWETHRLWQRG